MAAPHLGSAPITPHQPPGRSAPFCEQIFEHLPVPAFVIDFAPADTIPTILDCNAAACASTGYTRDELLGRPFAMISGAPLDPEERQESTDRMLGGEQVVFHSLRRHRDGTLSPVEVLGSMLVYEGRRVTLSVDRPIALADGGLDQNRRNLRLELALENAEMAVWDWEAGAGADAPLISAEGPFEAVLPEDQPAVRAALDHALETSTPCRVEFRAHDRQGRVRWLEGRSIPVRAQGGPVTRLLGTVMDITERKTSEEALRESEARLRLVLANARMALWEWDPALNKGHWSAEFSQMMGYPPDERQIEYQDALKHVHPDDHQRIERSLAAAIGQGTSYQFEMRFLRLDGSPGWAEAGGASYPRPDGTGRKLVGTIREITGRKLIDGALAGCLRTLLQPEHDESARRRMLAEVAGHLRLGVRAARVFICAVTGEDAGPQRLELIAETGPPEAAAVPSNHTRHPLPWGPLDGSVREALERGEPCELPVRGLLVHAWREDAVQSGLTRLLPVVLPEGLWGFLGVELEGAAVLGEQERLLAAAVVEMLQVSMRRWAAVDELAAGEQRLRLAVQAAEFGTWEWHFPSGRIVWSEQTARLFGIRLEAFRGTLDAFSDLVYPDDRDYVFNQIARAVQSGEPTRYTLRIRRADGAVRWLETLGQVFADEQGKPLRMLGVATDITERVTAEEALHGLNINLERHVRDRTLELEMTNRALLQEIRDREQAEAALGERERFLDRVMAATPSQVYIFDIVEQRTVYSNRSMQGLGFSPQEAAALGPFAIARLMDPADAARLPDLFEQMRRMADEAVLENEFRARHRDGSWRYFATRDVVFSRDENGTPLQILGVALDITAIKRAEEELAASLRRIEALNADLRHSSTLLGALVSSLSDGLALLDRRGVVLLANEALAALYGRSLAQIVGLHWQRVSPGTSALIDQTFQERAHIAGRTRVEQADGTNILLDLNTFPVPAADGTVEQLVLHVVDVTQRMQLETLAIQNERLATTGRIAAIVAHEVNSPLQAIQNFLFLASSDDPAERDDYLRMISQEIDRIGGLIRRLLDLNRPDAEERKAVDINELAERVLALTAGTLARHQIVVDTELTAPQHHAVGRGDHLTQVLLNLFLNALDAMPSGGKLFVRTFNRALLDDETVPAAESNEVLVIEVADSGAGIAPETLQQIFKPFYTTKPEGSGLGLAISHQIVEQHGGLLSVHNSPAGGAVFSVVLPLPGD